MPRKLRGASMAPFFVHLFPLTPFALPRIRSRTREHRARTQHTDAARNDRPFPFFPNAARSLSLFSFTRSSSPLASPFFGYLCPARADPRVPPLCCRDPPALCPPLNRPRDRHNLSQPRAYVRHSTVTRRARDITTIYLEHRWHRDRSTGFHGLRVTGRQPCSKTGPRNQLSLALGGYNANSPSRETLFTLLFQRRRS